MKLIIQIPCLDEEAALPVTLRKLPREVAGFDEVEWLVIDDGSTDRTVEVARALGVDHVVRLKRNTGLAAAFQAGLDAALKLGADVIVNTDADDQYDARDIPALVRPVVEGRADVVIGDRQVSDRFLQRLGSAVVRRASGTDVPDAASGFRAYNREAALSLQVVSTFTYTLETIIQAGRLGLAVGDVPVRTNPPLRESRLFGSPWSYVGRNAVAILRVYTLYRPLRVFLTAALVTFLVALALFLRFLVAFLGGDGDGHVQSLILGAVLFNAAMVLAAMGVLGDVLSGQRIMLQRTFERVRRIELELEVEPSHVEDE